MVCKPPSPILPVLCLKLTSVDVRSYIPPVQIGEVMRGATIGVVKGSKSRKFPVGCIASGTTGWTELAVMKDKHLEKINLPQNGRLTDALSVLGMLSFAFHTA